MWWAKPAVVAKLLHRSFSAGELDCVHSKEPSEAGGGCFPGVDGVVEDW